MNVAMKRPSAIFVVGSRRNRRSILGENWLEPNCTASRRIENTKPVNVIIPPTTAPSMPSAALAPNEIPIVVLVRSSMSGRTIPMAIASTAKIAGTIQRLLRTYS